MYIKRVLPLQKELDRKSVILLGPRRTGKSSLIKNEIRADKIYNLLESDTFQRLSARPSSIREALTDRDKLIVIDEIQKLPILMDEVHLMIEDYRKKFLLTGSSLRKLKRTYTSLMAGRAKSLYLHPFVSAELKTFDLDKILNFGLLPPVTLGETPLDELKTYSNDYLREEIKAEALSRNIENFSRFLNVAALSNAEIINFESIARDAGIPPRTIREYYALLEDTLLGAMLAPLKTAGKRKAISRGKFYFFDVGVVHSLTHEVSIAEDTVAYGKAFEQFIYQEIKAYIDYSRQDAVLNFWRTQEGDEVDFVVNGNIAIEVKSSRQVHENHLKGLFRLEDEQKMKRSMIVSRDKEKRIVGKKIEIYPYRQFLDELWGHEIF